MGGIDFYIIEFLCLSLCIQCCRSRQRSCFSSASSLASRLPGISETQAWFSLVLALLMNQFPFCSQYTITWAAYYPDFKGQVHNAMRLCHVMNFYNFIFLGNCAQRWARFCFRILVYAHCEAACANRFDANSLLDLIVFGPACSLKIRTLQRKTRRPKFSENSVR